MAKMAMPLVLLESLNNKATLFLRKSVLIREICGFFSFLVVFLICVNQ